MMVIGAVVLAGLAALADTPQPSTSARAEDIPSASVWRPTTDGGYEHILTGLMCPPKVGAYRRRAAQAFDSFGLDVGCTYSGSKSGMSFFLTRRNGSTLEEAMTAAKRELEEANAARRPELLSETKTRQGDVDRIVTTYSGDGGMRDVIWLADLSGWTLEYRFTYPTAEEFLIMQELEVFSAATQTSTAARFQTCAKARPAQRDGKPVTNKDVVESASMMTSILGGALQSAIVDKQAEDSQDMAPQPSVLCVERAGTYGRAPLVFLRSIAPDGSDRLTDHATAISAGAPITVSFAGGGLAGLLMDKPDQPQQWTATYDREGQTLIFGYFSGRPTVDQMGELVASMLSGKAKPVGGYSAKGKTITITRPPK